MSGHDCGIGEGTHYACDCTLRRIADLEARLAAAEAWQLAVADGLGYVNRPEGQGGYEVAEPRVILDAFRAAEAARDEALKKRDEVRETAQAVAKALSIASDAARDEAAKREDAELTVKGARGAVDYILVHGCEMSPEEIRASLATLRRALASPRTTPPLDFTCSLCKTAHPVEQDCPRAPTPGFPHGAPRTTPPEAAPALTEEERSAFSEWLATPQDRNEPIAAPATPPEATAHWHRHPCGYCSARIDQPAGPNCKHPQLHAPPAPAKTETDR